MEAWGLGLRAWVRDELRKKDGWSLVGERHTQIEQCGGTTKVPPGQGRQDDREKLDNGSERREFSLSMPDLVLFSTFHWVLDVWVFLCLYLKVT